MSERDVEFEVLAGILAAVRTGSVGGLAEDAWARVRDYALSHFDQQAALARAARIEADRRAREEAHAAEEEERRTAIAANPTLDPNWHVLGRHPRRQRADA